MMTKSREALRELRADPTTRAVPVIAVTASVMAQDRQKTGQAHQCAELLATMRGIPDRP